MTEAVSIIGNRTEWETFVCDSWRTERVRAASGLTQRPYVASGAPQLVPPSFLSAQYVDAFALGIPDAPTRLNGGNRCRWLADVYVGDALEKQSSVVDASTKQGASGKLEIYTIETIYRRLDDGTPVAELGYTAIRRYPSERLAGDPAAPTAGGGSRPAEVRGVPEGAELLLTATTTPRDVISYAVATDDMYEAHYDQEHARRAGLPGTITHGLLKLAWMARAAVERTGDGYVVREIGARYRALDLTTDPFEVWGAPANHTLQDEVRFDLYGVSVGGAVSTIGDAVLVPYKY